MNAARNEHLKATIEPALERGAVVVSDRYIDSTAVFQLALGRMSETEQRIIRSIHREMRVPDLTIYLIPSPQLLNLRWQSKRVAQPEIDVFEIDPMAERAAYMEVSGIDDFRRRVVVHSAVGNEDALSSVLASLHFLSVSDKAA